MIEDRIRSWASSYASRKGWVLNPDSKALDIVIRGLVRNCQKFGRPYCPCRLRSGDPEKDSVTRLPLHLSRRRSEGRGELSLQVVLPVGMKFVGAGFYPDSCHRRYLVRRFP